MVIYCILTGLLVYYIALWLDQSSNVWGCFHKNGTYTPANSLEDAWNVNMSFIYKF